MKRFLCFTLALLLLIPALLLPAAAAERKEYLFDYFEVPSAYADFPFLPNEDYTNFLHEGLLPEGSYKLIGVMNSHYDDPAIRVEAPDILHIEYKYEGGESNMYSCVTFFTCYIYRYDEIYGSLSSDIIISTFEINGDKYTLLSFNGALPMLEQIIFVDPVFDSLTGAFSENPNLLLSHVLSLLPIILPIVIGFIGIRKAVSWIRSKLSEA